MHGCRSTAARASRFSKKNLIASQPQLLDLRREWMRSRTDLCASTDSKRSSIEEPDEGLGSNGQRLDGKKATCLGMSERTWKGTARPGIIPGPRRESKANNSRVQPAEMWECCREIGRSRRWSGQRLGKVRVRAGRLREGKGKSRAIDPVRGLLFGTYERGRDEHSPNHW